VATKLYQFPRLSDSEFNEAARAARATGIPLSECPTCGATKIEVEPGVYGWENGTYTYHGKEYECNCREQMELRKHYLLSNIPKQYQELDWADFHGDERAIEAVRIYLDKWEYAKRTGMGLEFSSPTLGVGKTFCATYVGKELVKRGERVFFVRFLEVIGALNHEGARRSDFEDRLRNTTVLILDEVGVAMSDRQHELFAVKFEELIRYRTDNNRVTIMTTNLTPERLHSEYHRTYSLLEGKQIRVEMVGKDYRSNAGMENLELLANEEVRPIT
jgi:DNA replication protein DnaC